MKKIDVVRGIHRLIDAATEKFNKKCEEHGISPDDPRLTGEDEDDDLAINDVIKTSGEDHLNEMPNPDNMSSDVAVETVPMSALEQISNAGEIPQIPTGVEAPSEVSPETTMTSVPEEIPVDNATTDTQAQQDSEQQEDKHTQG